MNRILLVLALVASPALSQTSQSEAAEKFTLDLPVVEGDETVTATARFDLDTPIATLIGDPRAKAVLDRRMPGVSSDKNLDKFKDKSLRQLAPLSGGRLTPALLEQVGADLAAID